MKNSSYYIAPFGVRTHDLPHTVASNMGKVSHALTHSTTVKEEYVNTRLAERTWTATEPCCIARKAFDKRTPGLFKIEWCGDGFIGLCSKTYYCFGSTDKCTTKGLNKRQNTIDKDAFLSVLTNRRSGSGVNRGFRVRDSSVMTYIQERAALTYFYPKRKVLEDGLTTAPLDL